MFKGDYINLLSVKTETNRKLQSELIRVRNREKVAQSKLHSLKARFENVVDEVSSCKAALLASHYHLDALQRRLDEALLREADAIEESQAWKAKAFEKMDELEVAHERAVILEKELEFSWESNPPVSNL